MDKSLKTFFLKLGKCSSIELLSRIKFFTSSCITKIIFIFSHCFCGISNLSSSSYRTGSTDIPDPLSPLLPIVHRPR